MAQPPAAADAQGPRHYAGTLITQAGHIRYQHDQAGRIVLRQRARLSRKPDTWRYEWDADDRLTAVTTPDGTRWQYAYDPLGRRIAKQRLSPAGEAAGHASFTWDGLVLAEQATADAAGPGRWQVTTWDYRPGTFTPLTQAEHWLHASQDQVDQQFYAIITDLIGSPAELVGPDGALAGHQQHTLWGTTRWAANGASSPLRFPGQYADDETGLHYNHHRYYDPATGRYLSPDPLGLAPALNNHAYVPNPTLLTDPLGLNPGGAGGAGSGGGGGARFIVNSQGQVLDSSQVTIPDGKYGYLLNNPSKSGVFSTSMGYNQSSLGSALPNQLVNNFGDITPGGPMVDGTGAQIGEKFTVTSPLTGPSGQTWNITSVWGVNSTGGTVRFITSMPAK
jgi:RHS repeat-associated protein